MLQDLAPQYEESKETPKKSGVNPFMANERTPLPTLKSNGFFAFGKRQTSLVVLDGNGIEAYEPEHIRTFYDPRPVAFIESYDYYLCI